MEKSTILVTRTERQTGRQTDKEREGERERTRKRELKFLMWFCHLYTKYSMKASTELAC